MIDNAYKNYFVELNSLETKSNKIDRINDRLIELRKFVNDSFNDGKASIPSDSNFFNLSINFKNFQNEFDALLQLVLKDKFFDEEEYQIGLDRVSN